MTIITRKVKPTPIRLWFEKIMAIIALINLILVFFDLTYIPLRDFWLQGRVQFFLKLGALEYEIPNPPLRILPFNITPVYDLIKGIEPERFTSNYLDNVARLNRLLEQNQWNYSTENEARINEILTQLKEDSAAMISNNPFQIANKTGTLERIKRKMRVHVFNDEDASATQAFQIFWSPGHLSQNTQAKLDFFNTQIKPLMATNYYRPVGENGQPVNNFAIIDFPFAMIFLVEFFGRTWYISRRYTGVNWFDAMLWRWYDVFLFLPFLRWLRVIPVTIRLSQSELINLHRVQKQISQGFVANIAEDVTEVVVIQVINQIQGSINRGEIANFITQYNNKQYIDLNNVDETSEIVKMILSLTIQDVLPKLETDIERLLKYTIDRTLKESFENIEQLPGMQQIRSTLSEQVSKQIYQNVYKVLAIIVSEDPNFDKLLGKIVTDFRKIMRSEIQAQKSMQNLEYLLSSLLEEVKVNYIQRLSEANVEEILEQQRKLKQNVINSPEVKKYP